MLAVLAVALLLTGCTTVPGLLEALAKDPASVCVSADAFIYGRITICRSNAAGAADIAATPDGMMRLQHRGGQ